MANAWAKLLGIDENSSDPAARAYAQQMGGEEDPATTQPIVAPPQAAPTRAPANLKIPVTKREPTAQQQHLGITRGNVDDFFKTNQENVDKAQGLADHLKVALAEKGALANLSPLYQLADHYFGTSFSKGYEKPPTEDEQAALNLKAQGDVQKLRQPVLQDLLKEFSTENSSQDKYFRILANEAQRKATMADTGIPDDLGGTIKLDKTQQGVAEKMRGAMFLGRSSNSQVQQSIAKLRSGSQFENLVAAIPNGNPTPQDMADLTSALGQTVNGANILTDHRFKSLYPPGIDLSAAGVVQWLTGKPQGVDQKEWINRWMNEVKAEKAGALKTVTKWVDSQEKYFANTGLHPKFVKQSADAARTFFREGYEPVGGVGEFNAASGGKPPGAKMQKNKTTGETRWVMPDGTVVK